MSTNGQEAIRHIVLFTLGEEVTEEEHTEALRLLGELEHSVEGIEEWTIADSLDLRKGRIIGENALMRDVDTLERFRTTEQHRQVAAFMGIIADWQTLDYKEPRH